MDWEKTSILQTLRDIDSAVSADSALIAFHTYTSHLGFKDFFVAQLVSPSSPALRKEMTYTNWPDELLAQRQDQMKALKDPVVQYALRSSFPFRWEKAYEHTDKFGLKMAKQVWDHGLTDGLMFPLRRPGVPFAAVTLAGDASDVSPIHLSEIQLAVLHIFAALERYQPPVEKRTLPKLAPQEIEVLQFAAAGKTAWEIGMILGITENSVRDAIKRARAKLDAVNLQHAISRAIAEDLILP